MKGEKHRGLFFRHHWREVKLQSTYLYFDVIFQIRVLEQLLYHNSLSFHSSAVISFLNYSACDTWYCSVFAIFSLVTLLSWLFLLKRQWLRGLALKLFNYFCLCWVFIAVGATLQLQCTGCSLGSFSCFGA